jgi:hypothetical protein
MPIRRSSTIRIRSIGSSESQPSPRPGAAEPGAVATAGGAAEPGAVATAGGAAEPGAVATAGAAEADDDAEGPGAAEADDDAEGPGAAEADDDAEGPGAADGTAAAEGTGRASIPTLYHVTDCETFHKLSVKSFTKCHKEGHIDNRCRHRYNHSPRASEPPARERISPATRTLGRPRPPGGFPVKTYVRYYLNDELIEGWDEVDYDSINAEAALQSLTDAQPGDRLRIVRYRDGEIVEEVTVEVR